MEPGSGIILTILIISCGGTGSLSLSKLTYPNYQQLMFEILCGVPTPVWTWTCEQILMCGVPTPHCPIVQKVCVVSPLPEYIFYVRCPPPQKKKFSSGSVLYFKWSWEYGKFCSNYQSSSTCISECDTPNWPKMFYRNNEPRSFEALIKKLPLGSVQVLSRKL